MTTKSGVSYILIIFITIVSFPHGYRGHGRPPTATHHPDTYFPYEVYGEATMECVTLMTSQRQHVLAAEAELLRNYGVSEDYQAQKLLELFHSTEELLNKTFEGLCVRLQGELKPNERYDPISEQTFAKLAHTWNGVRRFLEQLEEKVDDQALLYRISGAAEHDMSKTYNFMKSQMKKLRDNGY